MTLSLRFLRIFQVIAVVAVLAVLWLAAAAPYYAGG